MSDDELDQVAGGTNGEYKTLRDILPNITYIRNDIFNNRIVKVEKTRSMDTNEFSDWLKENLNMTLKLTPAAGGIRLTAQDRQILIVGMNG